MSIRSPMTQNGFMPSLRAGHIFFAHLSEFHGRTGTVVGCQSRAYGLCVFIELGPGRDAVDVPGHLGLGQGIELAPVPHLGGLRADLDREFPIGGIHERRGPGRQDRKARLEMLPRRNPIRLIAARTAASESSGDHGESPYVSRQKGTGFIPNHCASPLHRSLPDGQPGEGQNSGCQTSVATIPRRGEARASPGNRSIRLTPLPNSDGLYLR